MKTRLCSSTVYIPFDNFNNKYIFYNINYKLTVGRILFIDSYDTLVLLDRDKPCRYYVLLKTIRPISLWFDRLG